MTGSGFWRTKNWAANSHTGGGPFRDGLFAGELFLEMEQSKTELLIVLKIDVALFLIVSQAFGC